MSTANQPVVAGNWGYLGGYFAAFIGWAAGLIGSITLAAAAEHGDQASHAAGLAVVGFGMLLVVAGVQVMARVGPLRLGGDPTVLVLFVLTPLPAVVGFVVNQLGQFFRRSDGFPARVGLLAVGASLVGMAVMWIAGGALEGGQNDDRAFVWPMTLQLGLALGGLGLFPPARAEEPVELIAAG